VAEVLVAETMLILMTSQMAAVAAVVQWHQVQFLFLRVRFIALQLVLEVLEVQV
jgi:hypothetical protein